MVSCLKLGGWNFLTMKGCTDIQFTNVNLLQEVVDDTTPTLARDPVAAGEEADEDTPVAPRTWLMEPFRASVVTKFSGTMQNGPRGHNLLSKTLAAFAHFTLVHSNGALVYVDLQGNIQIVVMIYTV
jgi:hypothetical protein